MNQNIEFTTYNLATSYLTKKCEQIADICNTHDKCTNPFFIDDEGIDAKLPCLYCATLDNEIIGYISTYIIDSEEAEICCFVLPNYRKQGIANELLDRLLTDYSDYYLQVATTKNNKPATAFLESHDFDYQSTECKMLLEKTDFRKTSKASKLSEVKTEVAQDSISFLAYDKAVHIGTCMVFTSGNSAIIHDVEIYEAHRNMGYGYSLLNSVLDNLFAKYDKVILHVTKENEPAYTLYLKLGFNVIEELEYYSL